MQTIMESRPLTSTSERNRFGGLRFGEMDRSVLLDHIAQVEVRTRAVRITRRMTCRGCQRKMSLREAYRHKFPYRAETYWCSEDCFEL